MRKEEEIAKLLSQGTPPVELIQGGFARGTVYKVNRKLTKEATPTPRDLASPIMEEAGSVADPGLEADPEILEKKKAVRMAELDQQLAEIKQPLDFEPRLARIKRDVDALNKCVNHLIEDVEGSLFMRLHQSFECTCGAQGLLAAQVHCTVCGLERSYGWFPGESR